jgi:hypothetical protein
MKALTKSLRLPVHADPDPDSRLVAELTAGTEIEVGKSRRQKGRDWVEATLANGDRGFIDAHSELVVIQQLVLAQDEAVVRGAATDTAGERARLKRGDRVLGLDTVERDGKNWVQVRLADGREGFIDGETRINAVGSDLGWLGSAAGGALVILAVGGGIGAVVLCVQGQFLGALALVVVCALGGGLAGMVHHLTRSLREGPFGVHVSWVLVVNTYLLSAGLCVMAASWFGGDRELGGREKGLNDPLFLFTLAGVGVLLGVYLAYSEQRQRLQSVGQAWTTATLWLPALGAAGAVLVIGGAALLERAREEWPLYAEAAENPREVTLDELIRGGPGDNRHVRVKDFRYCEKGVVIETLKLPTSTFNTEWVPVVPGMVQVPKGVVNVAVEQPGVPAMVRVVFRFSRRVAAEAPRGPRDRKMMDILQARDEQTGYEGVIVNGLRPLPASVVEQLKELAPDTDIARLIFVDNTVHTISAATIHERFILAGSLLGGGLLLLAGVVLWGRRVVARSVASAQVR